jgi:hypothetical protein
MNLKEIMHNNYGLRTVLRAARRTTPENPFLIIQGSLWHYFLYGTRFSQGSHWLVSNAFLNQISHLTSQGHIAKAMGMPVQSRFFIIALTRERSPKVK